MHLFNAHPILVAAILLGACLLALAIHLANIPRRALRIRISGSATRAWDGNYIRVEPPLARSFLRGRRFHWSREEARGQLYRLAARATRGGDDEAARFLDRAGLALWVGGAVVSEGALASIAGTSFNPELVAPQGATRTGGARDLRREDVTELRRRELADEVPPAFLPGDGAERSCPCAPHGNFRRPGEIPVYREPGTALMGYLARYDTRGTSFIASGGVVLAAQRGSWVTTDTAERVNAAFPGVFRAVALALLALLLPLAAHGAAFPAADLSQFHHPAIRWGSPVCATGYVESVRRELDGDVHAWLCPSATKRRMPERRQECVLGEIVPSMPLPGPARGFWVRKCGAWVEADIQHHWTEIHPVAGIEVLP